jgi:hypothetical protein
MPASYPSTRLNKANNLSTLYGGIPLDYGKEYNNCKNTLCYTYSKNYIYKPHSAYGMVGTSASSYLARRYRL